ncbi:MAG: flagellar basal body L-ring protein FlgH [Candidatus Magnetominusculus sp. LBB02]|nr:flagellar basal body L-ring protein FlgH [Candidatus Magnetominusculus sp. LBB02]
MKRAIKAIAAMTLITGMCIGCATPASKLPAAPSPYIYGGSSSQRPENGSLWNDSASLYEDRRAHRLNDIVMINIVEKTTADTKEETTGNKQSNYNSQLSNFFSMGNVANTKTPQIKSTNNDQFTSKGETKNSGTLTGTISAKVIEVLPNGNLVIDSRKEITVNYETQFIVLQGIIRPDDVSSTNTISSQKVADVKLYLVGDGYLQELQTPGWLGRIWGSIRPF